MPPERKSAVVTGAARGIGAAIVTRLLQDGYTVLCIDRDEEPLASFVDSFRDTYDATQCKSLVADLSCMETCHQVAAAATDMLDGCDILVNNAGISRDRLAIRMKDDEWSDVISVNLTAPFILAHDLVRGMIKKRWGRIVTMTSVVAVTGNAGQVNYSAAKAGLIGMTRSLAREVAQRNVTVNAVAPAFIETDMTAALPEEQRKNYLSMIPLKRPGTPDDVAHAVSFLVSEEASYITGQVLHVNGGLFT